MKRTKLILIFLVSLGLTNCTTKKPVVDVPIPPTDNTSRFSGPSVQVGDMILQTKNITIPKSNPGITGSAVDGLIFFIAETWPNGTIPIVFKSDIDPEADVITAEEKQLFKDTCQIWKDKSGVGCEFDTNAENYLLVEKGPVTDEVCTSTVGYTTDVQNIMTLGANDEEGRGCWEQQIILHELGHAFGLLHEHDRQDRDNFVRVLFENLDPSYSSEDFDVSEIYTVVQESLPLSDYDFLSIMHYQKNFFSIEPDTKNTLEPLPQFSKITLEEDLEVISPNDGFVSNYTVGTEIDTINTMGTVYTISKKDAEGLKLLYDSELNGPSQLLVVNAADYSQWEDPEFIPAIGPGSIITIYPLDKAFSGIETASAQLDDLGLLPVDLSGVSIYVDINENNEALEVPLLFVSGNQINAWLPDELDFPNDEPRAVSIQVWTQRGLVGEGELWLDGSRLGVFTRAASGKGIASASVYKQNGSVVVLDENNPVEEGDTIVFYGTGLNAFREDHLNWLSPSINEFDRLQVYIGGQPADVTYAGKQGAGVYYLVDQEGNAMLDENGEWIRNMSIFFGLDQINVVMPKVTTQDEFFGDPAIDQFGETLVEFCVDCTVDENNDLVTGYWAGGSAAFDPDLGWKADNVTVKVAPQ